MDSWNCSGNAADGFKSTVTVYRVTILIVWVREVPKNTLSIVVTDVSKNRVEGLVKAQ